MKNYSPSFLAQLEKPKPKPKLTREQKWVYLGLLALVAACLPSLIFTFSASPQLFWPGLLAGLIIALAISIPVWSWARQGLWLPRKNWAEYGRMRRLLVYMSVPFLLMGLMSVILLDTLPLTYTFFWGDAPRNEVVQVSKKRNYGRGGCRYALWVDKYRLRFCVDSDEFETLPDEAFSARLKSRTSPLGILGVELATKRPIFRGSQAPGTSSRV